MNEIIISVFILVGTLLSLLASICILRMPDLYLRMSATTKAATLGISATLVGVSFFFQELGIVSRVIIIILFIFITTPVASHIIGKAAYRHKIKLWDKTITDEYKDSIK